MVVDVSRTFEWENIEMNTKYGQINIKSHKRLCSIKTVLQF